MKLKTLIILIVLLFFIGSTGQAQIVPANNYSVTIQKDEFKFIVTQLAELSTLKQKYVLQEDEIKIHKTLSILKDSIIIRKDNIIEQCKKSTDLYKKELAEMNTFWNRNKFYIGAAGGIALTVVTILLVR